MNEKRLTRVATKNDYPAIAEIMTEARPDYPRKADDLSYEEKHRPAHCKHQYFIAIKNDKIAGYALYTQYADLYQQGHFHIRVYVKDDMRYKGIGRSLYTVMNKSLAEFSPEILHSRVREDDTAGFIFASKRGYMESSRRIEGRLDTEGINLDALPERLSALSAQGIELRSYAELADDPDRDKKMYAVHTAVDVDVPMDTPIIPLPYEQWRPNVIEHPQFLPEGTFVAIHEGQYVGISSLFQFVDDMAYVELTGTLSDYRRRGISTTLKLCGIRYAKNQNIPCVGVTNDAVNTGILTINEKMGFIPEPAIINLRLKV